MRLFSTSFLAACVIAAFSSGCSTHHFAKTGAAVDVVQFANVEAALEVGQPVEANVKVTEFLIFKFGLPNEFADGVAYGTGGTGGGFLAAILGGGVAEAAKAAAAYKALKPSESHVLLGARYELHIDDFFIFKKYDVTVRGTSAKITGFTQKAD